MSPDHPPTRDESTKPDQATTPDQSATKDQPTTTDEPVATALDPDRYLARLGLEPADVEPADLDSLRRLQAAHVTTVPFETLAITGDPHGEREGDGVSLARSDLYEKVVERRRGGFCYELNGLFGWLLGELGFEAERVAAMVVSDGDPRPPANHLTHVVALDRRYVVDVGMGVPPLRQPLPLDGDPHTDAAGVGWRLVGSDRPDADYATEYREPGEEWSVRYVFRDRPREMDFFAATCEFLATAPESPFTGDPVVAVGTERGYRKLSPEALTRVEDGEERGRALDGAAEWFGALADEFDLRYLPE